MERGGEKGRERERERKREREREEERVGERERGFGGRENWNGRREINDGPSVLQIRVLVLLTKNESI